MIDDHEAAELADPEGPAAELGLISGKRHAWSEHKESPRGGHRSQEGKARYAHWVVHFALVGLLAWTMLGHNLREQASIIVRPTEEMYEDLRSVLSYERTSMDPRSGPDQARDQSWIGPFDEQNTRLWHDLTTVGVLRITDNEYAAMGMSTSRANNTGDYFVVPQMFHDLHCLKRIRESYWTVGRQLEDHDRHHLDHCVEIFRRNIMCAADLSPYPFHWGGDKHQADYDVVRQCRAWDPIYSWSLKRNTTGYVL